jgi:hypothetical protein
VFYKDNSHTWLRSLLKPEGVKMPDAVEVLVP